MFLGEYEHSLDAKQRLAIPAEVRDAWKPDRHGEAFVAAPGQNGDPRPPRHARPHLERASEVSRKRLRISA